MPYRCPDNAVVDVQAEAFKSVHHESISVDGNKPNYFGLNSAKQAWKVRKSSRDKPGKR
jgi:hypothetical protein